MSTDIDLFKPKHKLFKTQASAKKQEPAEYEEKIKELQLKRDVALKEEVDINIEVQTTLDSYVESSKCQNEISKIVKEKELIITGLYTLKNTFDKLKGNLKNMMI